LGRAVVPLQLQLSCSGRRASSIISNGCMGVSHGSGLRLRLWHVVRSAATAHTQHRTTRPTTTRVSICRSLCDWAGLKRTRGRIGRAAHQWRR
jgi:hypothetical protein